MLIRRYASTALCRLAHARLRGVTQNGFYASGTIFIALMCMAGVIGALFPVNVRAADLPQDGAVRLGQVSARIFEDKTLVLHQSSHAAVIEWKSFSIAEDHAVIVKQPFHDSVLLNRVMGDEISVLAGALRASGAVLLVNPNGIHITESGRVTTGGFLASSVDIANDDVQLGAAALHTKVNGRMHSTKYAQRGAASGSGGVLNEGLIQVADAGYVSLVGMRVVHDGEITSRGGHVAISGPGYLRVEGRIDLDRHPVAVTSPEAPPSPNSPINLTQLTHPDLYPNLHDADAESSIAEMMGGSATSSLLSPGNVRLLGSRIDIHLGSPEEGVPDDLRSFVHAETLAGALRDADVIVSSLGTWLPQPGDMAKGKALHKPALPSSSDAVALADALQKEGWCPGDIQIASPVTWSANTSLTLASTGAIRFNAPVTALGSDPLVHVYPGVRHDITFGAGRLSMPGNAARFAISGKPYTVIRNATELRQAIQRGGAQDYAITHDLDLHGIAMSPITLPVSSHPYRINGLGHSVKGLAIHSRGAAGVGLFNALHGRSTVSNLHLVDPQINGVGETGAFVGVMHDQSRLTGVSVQGGNIRSAGAASVYGALGGIVGAMQDQSVISHAHLHNVVVQGVDNVGGIAGGMSAGAHIKDAVFSGATHGRDRVGGIVGQQRGGRVERVTLRGSVHGRHDVGGVAGHVGTGSLITAALSDANISGRGRAGSIAGSLAHGSRHRMVDNVTHKGEPRYGEHFGAYVGAYITPDGKMYPEHSSHDDAASKPSGPVHVAVQNAPAITVTTPTPSTPLAMPASLRAVSLSEPMSDHIRQLNPRPWNAKGCR